MKPDIDIAQEAQKRPIAEIAGLLGLGADAIVPFGHYIAKVPAAALDTVEDHRGKLILVTAMTPTSKGEGKTTTTIGLGQALRHVGANAMVAVREPSLGPCFGVKGGAAGGGYSQVLPMEDINLHFTGDLHAVTTAHNLLSALVDNHLHQRLAPPINARRVSWKRAIDMNDRSLRSIVVGLQGGGINGVMREDGFEITAASEVMAILCLAADMVDLEQRFGRIVVGYDDLRRPVTAADIGAPGAMVALLTHAMQPNLVQSIEGTPVFVHGGPFANIAHGCNTLVATRAALRLADYVVTEAGFGADLGAEKFFDIKCRTGGLTPAAAVLVVTRRAYALHGLDNVLKHAENIATFGVPVVVSINRFLDDDPEELRRIHSELATRGIEAFVTDYRESGGAGGVELAERVRALAEKPSSFVPLYELDQPILEKVRTIATRIYGADGLEVTSEARKALAQIETLGYGGLPVCMAKTPMSLSDDPKVPGRPRGFTVTITNAKVSAGAGFVVVYCGDVMTMPGLPKEPAAMAIGVDGRGEITGLF